MTALRPAAGSRSRGLVVKAAFSAAVAFAIFGALLTFVSVLSQQRLVTASLHRTAAIAAALVAEGCFESLRAGDLARLHAIAFAAHGARNLDPPDVVAVQILDLDGKPVVESRRHCTTGARDATIHWATAAIRGDGRCPPIGQVRIAVSSASVAADVEASRRDLIVVAGLFVLCAMSLVALHLRRMLRPIEDLCDATKAVAAGRFDCRVPAVRGDELGILGRSFNAMAEALEASTVRREELSRMNEELDRARADAVASAKSKSEFLANMSHEIRTPMTAILGYTEILLENTKRRENVEAARTIHANGKHLLSILDDILDLSKIEAGRMTVEKIGCRPIQLAQDVVELMNVRARAKNLELKVRLRTPLPEFVETDPTRLRQVLVNLIGNALKFTESGRVTLTVKLANEQRDRIAFLVEDSGIGMSQDQLRRLFAPFSQGDERTTRRFGGTGLGLAISRRLVELLGGEISVNSAPGRGSRFVVEIPTGSMRGIRLLTAHDVSRALPRPNAEPRHERPLEGVRVLLAEDGPDNQKLVTFLLRKLGSEVTLAEDGVVAVELATRALASDQPFDLILMDMQMPRMDGYTATARLRERGFRGPIVALTAHAMIGDRERCIAAGCDEFATKPIQRDRLVDVMRHQLARARR